MKFAIQLPICLVAACARLTAPEAAAIEAADDWLCPELRLIPVVGAGLAAACPGEEAWLKATLDRLAAQDGGTAPALSAAPAALGARLTARRGGRRLTVGRAPAGWSAAQVAVAQSALDANEAP
jgi:hypothetical protein